MIFNDTIRSENNHCHSIVVNDTRTSSTNSGIINPIESDSKSNRADELNNLETEINRIMSN